MKLLSWNVNGIRSVRKKGFDVFLKKEDPDVLCLQETRAPQSCMEPTLFGYPHVFCNVARRPGYSGTALFSKTKPLGVTCGLASAKHDNEGRVITAEYKDFFLVNVYMFVFQLMPVPGLDGAKLLARALPPRAREVYANLDQYLVLFVLVIFFLLAGPLLSIVRALAQALTSLLAGGDILIC